MTWTREVMQGHPPLPRNCHTMTNLKNRLYLIGGYNTGAHSAELHVYDTEGSQWTRPIVAGVVPVERYSHTCSGVGTSLILFGGFSATWLNDVHVLDTEFVQPFYPKLAAKGAAPAEPLRMHMWYQPQISGTHAARAVRPAPCLHDLTTSQSVSLRHCPCPARGAQRYGDRQQRVHLWRQRRPAALQRSLRSRHG